MDYFAEYRSKLRTADEAVRCVKSGDWVDYSTLSGFPPLLDAALARRRDELHGVKVRGNMITGPIAVAECDPEQEHFVYHSWHCSGYERVLCDRGLCYFTPMTYRNIAWYYRNHLTVNVAMVCVGPMDRHGCFALGCASGISRAIIDRADIVILEVNEAVPRIHGGYDATVQLSDADYIVEAGYLPLPEVPAQTPGPADIAIAGHILPALRDGAVIQLGIGRVPTALGGLIAQSELKDLGMHTELCTDGFLALHRAGKLTNRGKTLLPGRGVMSFAMGSRELYDWLDDNPGIAAFPIEYTNDPAVIGSNDNMISINACVSADLYGQVCAESSGLRQISGSGGQLDFVEGAIRSRGGQSFLCMSSTFTDKSGVLHSRILPHFAGDIVTTPRSLACHIVTEYGAVCLAGLSTWQRADALISIAHPDFRDGLIKDAEAQRIWLPSNKR